MLPIGDDNSRRRGPAWATWILIASNIAVFALVQGFGRRVDATMALALIPGRIAAGKGLATLLTSQFTHAGFGHIASNMLFLGIFGDNVECRIGRIRYLALYFLSGVAGLLAHTAVAISTGNAGVPLVGASAAISGIMGAYLALFPGNRVTVLLFNFIPTRLSAWVVIGFWFVMQVAGGFSGWTSGGVAYLAHLGGFAVAWLWARRYRVAEARRIEEERAARSMTDPESGVRWWIVDKE